MKEIEEGKINSWEEVHVRYLELSEKYHSDTIEDALALLLGIGAMEGKTWNDNLREAIEEQKALLNGVIESRRKDYTDVFRTVTFADDKERDAVLGPFSEDPLLEELTRETEQWSKLFTSLMD